MASGLGLHAGAASSATAAGHADAVHHAETVIRPAHATFGLDLRELWQYRHLFAALVWRDNLMACQFHPEKSQRVGLAMYANFAAL